MTIKIDGIINDKNDAGRELDALLGVRSHRTAEGKWIFYTIRQRGRLLPRLPIISRVDVGVPRLRRSRRKV